MSDHEGVSHAQLSAAYVQASGERKFGPTQRKIFSAT